MANTVFDILLHLVNQGELTGQNLSYLGESLQSAPVASGGWDWDNRHPTTGCPRSRGVDALRETLSNIERLDLLRAVPIYHCGDFWSDKDFTFGQDSTQNRFEFTAEDAAELGFTPEQANDVVKQLIALNGQEVLFAWIQSNGSRIMRNRYRGEPGGVGFTADDKVHGNNVKPGLPQSDTPARPLELVYHPAGRDHFIYDICFRMDNDDAVTRYWTSWARAWGANV